MDADNNRQKCMQDVKTFFFNGAEIIIYTADGIYHYSVQFVSSDWSAVFDCTDFTSIEQASQHASEYVNRVLFGN